MSTNSDQDRDLYRKRLKASVHSISLVLKQGWVFSNEVDLEESTSSACQSKFLEFHNELIKMIDMEKAFENHQLTIPIQRDIVHSAALETTAAIVADIGNELFAILVDEAFDINSEPQIAVVLRYVNKSGSIIERFLGIVHVECCTIKDITALSLKLAIDELLCKHGLSISRIRGLSYDGASNIQRQFNSLKSLIFKENPCAYYVHWFAHQLQHTFVEAAQGHLEVYCLFKMVSTLTNVFGGSCKPCDMIHDKKVESIREALGIGEIPTGQSLNQETSLNTPHYVTLSNLILMFPDIVEVLEIIEEEGTNSHQRAEAYEFLDKLNFDFAFTLHLMKDVLGISHELSQALQKRDIMNAMNLVNITKQRLQTVRNNGWESLLHEVILFCDKNYIDVPNMEDMFVELKSRRQAQTQPTTKEHHYRVDLFNTLLDKQLHDLNDRFDEINTQLLLCLTSLDPANLFSTFDKTKLIEFASFYPHEFSPFDLGMLDNQLEAYIIDMRNNVEFASLKGLDKLSEKMVETGKHVVYPLVYLLLKLALILPVAKTTEERAFSTMKIMKDLLRYQTGDAWMNDCLVPYIERDVFSNIDKELIIQRFENLKSRGG